MKRALKTVLLTITLSLLLCASAEAMTNDMLKVGIKYGENAVSEANLQIYSSFGGFAFGYFDEGRAFVELARVGSEYEKITVMTETSYAVELEESFESAAEAQTLADEYGGYVAYTLEGYRVRIGTYNDKCSAEAAQAVCAEASHVAGNSGTGVKVFSAGTNTVLFGFDCSGLRSLGILPVESEEKTVTWFRGFRYYGGFEYQRITGGNMSVINVVGIEDYVKCVIPWEMSNDWPVEALKAQSVCARTYAAAQTRHAAQGFDVCTTTDCQTYQGTSACSEHSDSAAEDTAGEYLYYNGSIVKEAVYYSSNGGASEDCKNVWGNDVPYLKGKEDPYETYISGIATKYHWSTSFTAGELTSLLKSKGYDIGTVKNLYVSRLTDNGNVYEITFVGTNGTKTFTRETCRMLLSLRSMRFSVSSGAEEQFYVNGGSETTAVTGAYVLSGSGAVNAYCGKAGDTYVLTADGLGTLAQKEEATSNDTFVITGSGNGHHVGMSQWGAYAMADLGYDYREILQFYYTGVEIY